MNSISFRHVLILFLCSTLCSNNLLAQPAANNDNTSGNEDQLITLYAIQSNDVANGGTLVISSIDLNPALPGLQSAATTPHGQWTVNYQTGNVLFVPNLNYNGTETVNYTIQNALGQTSNIAQLTVTLNAVNDAPVTVSNFLSIVEDSPIHSGNMLSNGDYDIENTALSCVIIPVNNANNGIFTLQANGNFTYVGNPNFFGVDTVVVSVCDNGSPLPAACSHDTLFINVTPVNDAPNAVNDAYTVNANSTTNLSPLANDSDIDNPLLVSSLSLLFGPLHGTATLLNGQIIYACNPGFSGMDSIYYQICDSATPLINACSQAWIHITVSACGLNPAADCDGDGVPNGIETADGTNPNNPCDYLTAHQTLTVGPSWVNADCDGDGYTNGVELGMGYDVKNPCSFPFMAQNASPSANWISLDCDGDGVTNGNEIQSGTDATNSCSLYAVSITLTPSNGWLAADCDGDGVSNGTEISNNTNPTNPCSLLPASVTLPIDSLWYFLDCDGDGVQNGDELEDSTYYLDVCNYLASSITMPQTSVWLNADCDGDGVTNGTELVDMTNPQSGCEFIASSQTLPTSAAWNAWDCDQDGVTNAAEDTDNTNLNDPCSFLAASITLPIGAAFTNADCDNDGLTNGAEVTLNTNPFNPDTDGDGLNDGAEVNQSSDPLNPCDPVATLDSCNAALIFPEGISPNGDNFNEMWTITGADYYPNNRLTIFNRFGSVVYTFGPGYTHQFVGKSNVATLGDTLLPEGVYFYVFDRLGDESKVEKGNLYIKR